MVSKEDFEVLKARVDVLEESASGSGQQGVADECASHSPGRGTYGVLKSFEMWCDDFDEDAPGVMKMFLPEGSILWNGENVPIENVEDDELVISSAAGWICGHVFEDGDSHYATIDRNETAEGSVVDFKIAKTRDGTTFSDDEEDDYQVVVGAISFGDGGGEELSPGPFNWTEREEDGETVKCLGNLYVSFGRVFLTRAGTLDVPSGSGVLCVRVTHPAYSGGQIASAEIAGLEYATAPLNSHSNLDYTLIPLYVVGSDGEVACDLRNVPTAVVRE